MSGWQQARPGSLHYPRGGALCSARDVLHVAMLTKNHQAAAIRSQHAWLTGLHMTSRSWHSR
jgi:hypothetical protein